ncbi:MAG: hypothetical protein IJY46_00180 [Lentisphaeria bacterium]|nr:hypothetical protein [Lentisphaeria bacterium]
MKNTTCGGASRAILRANLRTHPRSSTVVHSLGFALIYPQPCTTMHPPVEFILFFELCGGEERTILLLSSAAVKAKEDAPRSIRRSSSDFFLNLSVSQNLGHFLFFYYLWLQKNV